MHMKKLFKLTFLLLALFWVSFAYADNSKSSNNNDKKTKNIVILDDTEPSSIEKPQSNEENPDQKYGSWEADKAWKEEKEKMMKNINNLLIESYKVKFWKILQNLSYNIKWKTREEKLKILTSVLLSVKAKLNQIESWKVKLTTNRKQVLVWILKFIKAQVEEDIDAIAKEK